MTRKLAYAPKFKQLVREHPGLIKDFLSVRDSGARKWASSGILIKKIKPLSGSHHKNAWKVRFGKQMFFVKETRSYELEQDGYSQFMNLSKLKDMETDEIKVVNHYLGFNNCEVSGPRGKTSFLVLDFIDLPKLDDIEMKRDLRLRFHEWIGNRKNQWETLIICLNDFAKKAEKEFGIRDLYTRNAFYDKKNGRLIVFDPSKK